MNYRRIWICVFLFTLTLINYTDRVALSVAVKPISTEFGLSPVQMGFLLSSFLWMYVICLLPVGLLVDRWGMPLTRQASLADLSPHGGARCTGHAIQRRGLWNQQDLADVLT